VWHVKVITLAILAGITINFAAAQVKSKDIEEYYGFDEIEIIKLDWGISELTIADFNGDKRNDIAIANNRKARIELLLQQKDIGPGEKDIVVDAKDVDINEIESPSRFKKDNLSVSQEIFSLVCGDLNSDGLMDMAFYGVPEGLYIIPQKAGKDKNKLNWERRKKIKIDDGLRLPSALVCADLNNDGNDDLALAGQDSIYIILQKNDGSLAEPVKYPVSDYLRAIRVGDLNGDGINDIVTVTNDNEKPIHVRFGLPTGQMGPQIKFFIETPRDIKLQDIDGEAGDEILTVDNRSSRLMCYKLSSKKDTNSTENEWPMIFYPLPSGKGKNERDLVAGDFDGDGLVDVVISEPTSAELFLYKHIAGLGLAEPMKFPAFANISNLSDADIDNDGKIEIAVLSIKEKTIGISRFEDERLSFPEPVNFIGEPLAMELADTDNDNMSDLVYISKDSNDVRSLRVNYSLVNNTSTDDKTASQGCEIKKLSSNPEGIKIVDVDQDGLKDVLVFVKYEPIPVLIRQVNKGEFEVVDSSKAQSSLIVNATINSITVADVDDKPGKELLIAKENFARSLVFSEGKKWKIKDQYNAKSKENKISAVGVFDIDNDEKKGKPAILLLDGQKGQIQILNRSEDKTYRFEKEIDVDDWNPVKHLKFLYEPLTGNGKKSILLFDSEEFAIITPPNHSVIPMRFEQLFSYGTKIKDGLYGKVVAGDMNFDGWCDIVMVEGRKNHFEILALDSETKPIASMRFRIFEKKSYRNKKRVAGIEPRELEIADVTGDDKNDLVTIIHDRLIIYPQD
jgi:hypothetical protein